ncbi:MAG: beta strand repeat-containing protein, partial [Arcobacter sp.]|uniref:beta strand repeat-containing protein n=1 Tax=Arcobacter sp. TaxID=1872629 RepID=UPI003D081BA4
MKSFRVVNAKFRILKGGKIGLSLSISLVVSSLIFSTTKANAVDYFTDVQVSTGTATNTTGLYDVTVQTATNTGTFDLSRLSTTYDSVVFKPVSWVSSSYGTPSFVGNFDSNSDSINDGSTYSLNATSSTDKLTLTFNTNANAGSISKDNTTVYSAPITTNVDIYANSTYNLTTSTSTAYTANLIFQGSNNISGATNIGDGNIKLNGGVTFGGTVNAGYISVDTTNTIIFNSNVDLTAGTTDAMNFSVNGKVLLNEDFTANITSSGDNLGTVTIVGNGTGKEQIITGNIGTSTSSDIGILYIGSDTIDSNYSRTVIYGDVYANSTVLNNNGTTNSSSTLVLANGSDITSTITTADVNMGILTLLGSSTVTGTVGSTGKLAEVNSGATGSNSTFIGTVNSVNVTNTGTGTTIFQDDVTATNVNVNSGTSTFQDKLTAGTTTITTGTGNFNTVSGTTSSNIAFTGDGVANLNRGLTGNVTTNSAGTGTLNLVGSNNQTVNGNVGVGNALKDVNSGVNGTTSTFIGTVNSVNVTNTGTGTTIFQDDVTATNVNVNSGTSTFQD